jgi:CHASE3 domain sensor protein
MLEVENKRNEVLTLATDAEIGQRGFLLTGRDTYLDSYKVPKENLLDQIDTLREQTTGNPQQQAQVQSPTTVAAAKLAELESTSVLRLAGRPDDALAIVNDDSGRDTMTRIRQIISEMRIEGDSVLCNRTALAENLNRLALIVLIATVLLLILAPPSH